MNVNIYYGGRGLIEDPSLYVISKVEEVLKELRVNVTRYNLYEMKNTITTLPQTLKEVDGIILAASVEWRGIGGYLNEFLDACWLFGDKNKIQSLYMCPIVISTTYGEKEAMMDMKSAWELLGGLPCPGICSYVENNTDFEMNREYCKIIEAKAENIYRTISQKKKALPSSSYAIKQNIMKQSLDLTPQESEQLSKYAADDYYIKQQKEDIEELASMFKGMLMSKESSDNQEFIKDLKNIFNSQEDFKAKYLFEIDSNNKILLVDVYDNQLKCEYIEKPEESLWDVYCKISSDILRKIIKGEFTFQRSFMTGEMSAKGDFKTLRMLDVIFPFKEI